jgi:hypothetical protein
MAELANILRQVKQNEIDQAEAKLAAEVSAAAGEFAAEYLKPELTDPDGLRETKERLNVFQHWCLTKGAPALPAKPTTVAAWVLSRRPQDEQQTRITVAAIERAHDIAGLANPVATFAVRFALSKLSAIPSPRSWTKPEQLMFAGLPLEAQGVIARREQDREKVMRRAQNEASELRRLLAVAVPKTSDNTTTEKEINK